MRLQQLIRPLLVIISCFVFSNLYGQRDTMRYVKSPYRLEYTPHFELSKFKRGFSEDSLRLSLDSLESKPRTNWSRKDSLQFAEISLRTGNTALSEYYFDHLEVKLKTEEKFWFDHLMIYYLKKEYKKGLREISKESPMILEFSKMYFFKKIFEAQIQNQKNSNWYETNIVFGWTADTVYRSMDRSDPAFITAVNEPLKNLEKVLQLMISFVHDDDPVIASSLREMGHIIMAYYNFTHTYIAYSMARHYNKKDKALLEELRYVKGILNQKKYKIPNFRKYFPRIQKGRLEYDVLKEKVIFQQNDTTKYVRPKTMKPKEKPLLTFPHQFIVIGGLALMILLLSLILKTKK